MGAYARRRLLIGCNVLYGEPGDVELGDCAINVMTGKRGFITNISGESATITLGDDRRKVVLLILLRAVRERARGPDTRSGRL